ncbi:lipopolysaccharide biosynthesis protein [Halococcus saccharolyticus]|uniref:Polysaccharide biosynthesis protein n=1 Tax=Halococcus saccharolyticus DSM 5350 TaxID=1227455 RepID=M0MN02_9EURY|nr:oligosaccharide flippase family protein [Halococcus saccharolyticus]EMA47057.1 polysaccharide biosynthesis protein [Halococcus saccharolyticus DSM 5350]
MSESDTERVTDVFEQFAHDLGFYTVARFAPAVTSVVALVVFTHAFPPEAYGRYALTLSIAGVLGTACYGWINQAIIRFEPHVEPAALYGNVAWLVTLIGTVFVVLGCVGFVFFGSSLGAFAPFVLAGTAFAVTDGMYHTFKALLQARLESRSAAVYDVVQSVGGLVLAIVVAFVLLDGIIGWLWGAAIASGVAAGALAIQLGFNIDSMHVDAPFARRMARYGFPLIGWLVGLSLLNFGDQVLIELLQGSEATGIYASNYSVAHYGLGLVFEPFVGAVGPVVMNLWDGDNGEELAEAVSDMTRYLLLIGVPAVIGLSALSRVVSGLLLDQSYVEGAVVIPIVAAGLLVWNVALMGQQAIEVKEKTTVLFGGIALVVVVNIAINIPLILVFGYTGAAVATLLSFVLYAVFIFVASRQFIPWRLPRQSIRNVGIASIGLLGPYAAVFSLGGGSIGELIVASVAGTIAYLVTVYFLDELSSDELLKLKRLLTSS